MVQASGTFAAAPAPQQRRRQFLAPPSILAQYGANAILLPNDNDSSAAAPAVVLGIALQGWNITTWQGTIANEEWLEQMIYECEACAQPSTSAASDKPASRRRRKLNVPEMVFGAAYVTLEQQQRDFDDHDDAIRKGESNESKRKLQLGWNAKQALMEWARAHEIIPLPSFTNETESTTASATPKKDDHHSDLETGVTILQSMDAALWRQKNGADPSIVSTKDTATIVVHYDWTFSTPYCGHVQAVLQQSNTNDEEEEPPSPQEQHFVIWKSLASSGIKLELLTDQSIPILYYDEIILLEDDLHDNGQVEYSVKLRVMPHCIYVLARLWLCVDQVVLRLRETRLLVEFVPDNNTNNKSEDSHNRSFPSIHRDVTWRECAWKDLPKHSLPTSLAAWCGGGTTGATASTSARGATPSGVESPEFRARLAKLPLQPTLPANLSPHAVLVEQEH